MSKSKEQHDAQNFVVSINKDTLTRAQSNLLRRSHHAFYNLLNGNSPLMTSEQVGKVNFAVEQAMGEEQELVYMSKKGRRDKVPPPLSSRSVKDAQQTLQYLTTAGSPYMDGIEVDRLQLKLEQTRKELARVERRERTPQQKPKKTIYPITDTFIIEIMENAKRSTSIANYQAAVDLTKVEKIKKYGITASTLFALDFVWNYFGIHDFSDTTLVNLPFAFVVFFGMDNLLRKRRARRNK